MAKYSAVKATVNAYIKQNGRKEITGKVLNAVLNATIDSLGKYFQFAGGALPTDNPGTPDQNVCYLAGEPGVYTNFGGITIENEEVALLFWNGEWTKQRILIGIREVNASVDNQVGTPSVDVSYSGGELVLTFHNLKGEHGDTGDPAGFGTIGADINGGVGTPGVSVETSGDNTAKNLMFHFTNLKGETGVTSVVATIDDTSGTPSCQVSLVGQQLTLAFSGLKGLKGDTGVSADYPITIYNGLDSDATDQALAAAQGKVLDGKVSQLSQEVDKIVFQPTDNIPVAGNWPNFHLNANGIFVADNDASVYRYIVTEGERIYLKLAKDTEGVYQFQNAQTAPTSGTNANRVGPTITVATEAFVTVPQGATRLYVSRLKTTTTNEVKNTKSYSFEEIYNRESILEDRADYMPISANEATVAAGSNHSSNRDQISVKILSGQKYWIITNGFPFAYYADGTNEQIAKEGTAAKDIARIGIYYNNSAGSEPATIHAIVFTQSQYLYDAINAAGSGVSKEDLRKYDFHSVYNEIDISTKCKEYSAMLNNSGIMETFVFMTDPHLLGSSWSETTFKAYIGLLQKYYNMLPVDWLVCGGDWLTAGDTQDNACWKLGYMDATMRKLFKYYYPILGNHDINYQGVVSADDSSRGDLSHQTLVNLMFRENKNTYYEWKGNNTRFFALDAGIDWTPQMDSFRWEQIAWLAGLLLSNTDEHIVLLTHIYYNSGTTPAAMADNLQLLAGAFNGRTSVTLNGVTYDFSNAQGTIHCIIAGHTHADYIIEENVNVPVWITTNMQDGNTPTFDLLIIDYTAGKMKSIRVGAGSNRELNLAQ